MKSDFFCVPKKEEKSFSAFKIHHKKEEKKRQINSQKLIEVNYRILCVRAVVGEVLRRSTLRQFRRNQRVSLFPPSPSCFLPKKKEKQPKETMNYRLILFF